MTGFHLIGEGRWSEAGRILDEALAAFERAGDGRWRDSVLLTSGNIHFLHLRSGGKLLYERGLALARQRDDRQMIGWGALGCAGSEVAAGRCEAALASLQTVETALGGLKNFGDTTAEYLFHGVRAAALWRLDRREEALLEVARANAILNGFSRLLYYPAVAGHLYVCEVSLRAWEASGRTSADDVGRATQAVADLRRFARFFPIGRPGAHIWRGVLLALRGRTGAARRAWLLGLDAAERLDMPYERGLAHHELARHLPPGDGARRAHVERACEAFASVGAAAELALAMELLEAPRESSIAARGR